MYQEQATLKVARKLAHFYNEEARAALIEADGTERAEDERSHLPLNLSKHVGCVCVLENGSILHCVKRSKGALLCGVLVGVLVHEELLKSAH
eukprot:320396-Amphidinium_carterae.1